VILVDQLRSIDWRARDAAWIGRAPAEVMAEVMAKLRPLVGFRA
jgi:mRNA interferase MazF